MSSEPNAAELLVKALEKMGQERKKEAEERQRLLEVIQTTDANRDKETKKLWAAFQELSEQTTGLQTALAQLCKDRVTESTGVQQQIKKLVDDLEAMGELLTGSTAPAVPASPTPAPVTPVPEPGKAKLSAPKRVGFVGFHRFVVQQAAPRFPGVEFICVATPSETMSKVAFDPTIDLYVLQSQLAAGLQAKCPKPTQMCATLGKLHLNLV